MVIFHQARLCTWPMKFMVKGISLPHPSLSMIFGWVLGAAGSRGYIGSGRAAIGWDILHNSAGTKLSVKGGMDHNSKSMYLQPGQALDMSIRSWLTPVLRKKAIYITFATCKSLFPLKSCIITKNYQFTHFFHQPPLLV